MAKEAAEELAILEEKLRVAKETISELLGWVNVGDVRHYWQGRGEQAALADTINRANRTAKR